MSDRVFRKVSVQLTSPDDLVILVSRRQVESLLAVNRAIHGHGDLTREDRRMYAAFAKALDVEITGVAALVRSDIGEVPA